MPGKHGSGSDDHGQETPLPELWPDEAPRLFLEIGLDHLPNQLPETVAGLSMSTMVLELDSDIVFAPLLDWAKYSCSCLFNSAIVS